MAMRWLWVAYPPDRYSSPARRAARTCRRARGGRRGFPWQSRRPTVEESRKGASKSALRHPANAAPLSTLWMEQPVKLGPRGRREGDAVHAVVGADRAAIGCPAGRARQITVLLQ